MDNNYNNYNNNNSNNIIGSNNYNQIGGEPANIIMEQNNVIGIDDQYKGEPPKKKGRTFYLIIGIIAGLVLFGFIIYFNVILRAEPEPKPSDGSGSQEALEKEEKELNSNYQVIDTKLSNSDVLIEVKNNNDKVVQSTLRVELYDKTGNVLDKINFAPLVITNNSSSYESFSYDPTEAASYKVFTKLSKFEYIKNLGKDISIVSSNLVDKKISFEYMNDSDVSLNYLVCGIFFYNSSHKIVGYVEYVSTDEVVAQTSSFGEVALPLDNPLILRNSGNFEIKVLTALQVKE